jgi:hypothetical protein
VAQSSELAADGGAETASEASTSQVSYSPTWEYIIECYTLL